MIKVIYFTDTFYSKHGGRTHAREFYKAMLNDKRVSEIELFPTAPSTLLNSSTDDKINLKYLINKSLKTIVPKAFMKIFRVQFPKIKVYKELVSTIKKQGSDVLIIRHSVHFKYLSWLAKDFPELKIVVEFNASLFNEGLSNVPFISYWRKQEIKSLKKANLISAVSVFLKDYLTSNSSISNQAIIVNPNGVDIDSFKQTNPALREIKRSKINIPRDAIVFGYVGGMEKFRRLPEVMERFISLLKNGYDKLFLVLIGNGEDLPEILKMQEKYSGILGGHFYCNENWVSYDEIPGWMYSFDVGLFPFTAPYCSPLKIFEFAACGLPIIGPKVPAITENSGGNLCSFLINQDGGNFEESFIELYDNIEQYKLQKNKLDRLIHSYSWGANVDRIVSGITNRV